jgi:hypothetical protein
MRSIRTRLSARRHRGSHPCRTDVANRPMGLAPRRERSPVGFRSQPWLDVTECHRTGSARWCGRRPRALDLRPGPGCMAKRRRVVDSRQRIKPQKLLLQPPSPQASNPKSRCGPTSTSSPSDAAHGGQPGWLLLSRCPDALRFNGVSVLFTQRYRPQRSGFPSHSLVSVLRTLRYCTWEQGRVEPSESSGMPATTSRVSAIATTIIRYMPPT